MRHFGLGRGFNETRMYGRGRGIAEEAEHELELDHDPEFGNASTQGRADLILLVFALGWVLGPIRELWAVPRFGRITALLCEAVIMVIAMLLTTVCNTRTLAINAGADGMTLIGNGSPCHPRRGSES